MGQIVEFPNVKESKEKIRRLKKELEELLLEKDHLQRITCQNIRTAYTLTFGDLEYKLYKASCDYLRLRRKKELIQAKKNRQEKINIKAIERQLDDEFVEYKKKLDEKIAEVNRALKRSAMERLSDDETKEIKKVYKSIVKRLHPDLHPSLSEPQKELFYRATEAYEHGDLAALKLIDAMVDSGETEEALPSSAASLEKEVKRLEDLIEGVQKAIEAMKSTPPYTWRIYLEDEEKKAEKLSQLKRDLANFETAIRTQEEAIRDLMRDEA